MSELRIWLSFLKIVLAIIMSLYLTILIFCVFTFIILQNNFWHYLAILIMALEVLYFCSFSYIWPAVIKHWNKLHLNWFLPHNKCFILQETPCNQHIKTVSLEVMQLVSSYVLQTHQPQTNQVPQLGAELPGEAFLLPSESCFLFLHQHPPFCSCVKWARVLSLRNTPLSQRRHKRERESTGGVRAESEAEGASESVVAHVGCTLIGRVWYATGHTFISNSGQR